MALKLFSYIWTSGIWKDDVDGMNRSYGGQDCFNYYSIHHKLLIAAIWGPIQAYTLISNYRKCKKDYENFDPKYKGQAPNIVEKLVGVFMLAALLLQFGFKFATGTGIWMFNPCHTSMILQCFILLTPKTFWSDIAFRGMSAYIGGNFLGYMLPDVRGLDMFLEYEVFMVEHLFGGIIGPLVIYFSGRYVDKSYFSAHSYLFAVAWNGMHNRFVMMPLGHLTWANLNFNLCPCDNDPVYHAVGWWYLWFADLYVGGGSGLYWFVFYGISRLVYNLLFNPKERDVKSIKGENAKAVNGEDAKAIKGDSKSKAKKN